MSTDPRGRWFRVYAKQVRLHPKFRDLSTLELGAWTALRAEAELRDGAAFTDEEDALFILRRRKTPKARVLLERLVSLRLFDRREDGTIAVHDRDDHDRPKAPSDEAEATRRRKAEERARKAAESHDLSRDVTTRDEMSRHPRARTASRASPQPSASSQQPQPADAPGGWLAEDQDSAAVACRMFLDGGKWLGDLEYVAAWEELDRRFTSEWVQAEIKPAYADCREKREKVRPWDLKRMVELRCAERSRREELEREKAERERVHQERQRHIRSIEEATPEQRERAAYQQAAIRIAAQRGVEIPVDPAEVRAFVDANGGIAA